ncbi:MAG: very-short-patch-repair endonuclease [Brevundimonas sp.]|uniref:endonuclease domain-containing protein n=1 Tax=Brevundimonas sp. TaxID=1871086 RepID=UPI0039E70F29
MDSEARTERARTLRQRETRAEAILWTALRSRRLDGLKFRRQQPIGRYFADFACEDLRLVIELDGEVHDDDDQMLYDHHRQAEIEALGWSVIRFRNDEVTASLSRVMDAVRAQARLAGAVTPHPPAQLR